MFFEKYDPDADMLVRGLAEVDDLGDDVVALLQAREQWLLHLIMLSRCMAAECCAEAKAAIPPAPKYGAVLMLSTTDVAQEFNDPAGYPVQWNAPDVAIDGAPDFHHDNSPTQRTRGKVETAGLTRLYAVLTYQSSAAYSDLSIRVSFRKNGSINLPTAGRHGYIKGGGPTHTSSSSSAETWAMLDDGDYIEVIATQNGAAGVVTPIPTECLFIMERKPQET